MEEPYKLWSSSFSFFDPESLVSILYSNILVCVLPLELSWPYKTTLKVIFFLFQSLHFYIGYGKMILNWMVAFLEMNLLLISPRI